jgi:hypothetical protein
MTGLAGAIAQKGTSQGVPTSGEQSQGGFFVDSIEDGIATIVTEDPSGPDGFKTEMVPLQQLPPGIKEGDTVMPDGSIQPGSMDVQNIEARRSGLAGADPGGDIKL